MKTLITAANSAQAHRLKYKLNADTVILGDYEEIPALMLHSGMIISLPNPASPAYTHEMLTLCLDKNITVIYPLRDIEWNFLKTAEQLFNEYGIALAHG